MDWTRLDSVGVYAPLPSSQESVIRSCHEQMYSFHTSLSPSTHRFSKVVIFCHILRIKLFMPATTAATGTVTSVNGIATATANITSQYY